MTATWPKIEIYKIQDGGGRHLENRFFGHNLSTDCPISAKFCVRKQNGMSIRAAWQKLQIFKIQDGGRPPFWKWFNPHISVKNCPILMKLGTLHQILNPVTVTWPKVKIFKIQDGGGHHLENRFIAITHQPIVQFQQNLYEEAERHVNKGYGTKKSNFKNPRWRMAAILKIVKSPYLSEKLSDFDEIRYTTANVEPDCSHVIKN